MFVFVSLLVACFTVKCALLSSSISISSCQLTSRARRLCRGHFQSWWLEGITAAVGCAVIIDVLIPRRHSIVFRFYASMLSTRLLALRFSAVSTLRWRIIRFPWRRRMSRKLVLLRTWVSSRCKWWFSAAAMRRRLTSNWWQQYCRD